MLARTIRIGNPTLPVRQTLTVDEAYNAVGLSIFGAVILAIDSGSWAGMCVPVMLIILFTLGSDKK